MKKIISWIGDIKIVYVIISFQIILIMALGYFVATTLNCIGDTIEKKGIKSIVMPIWEGKGRIKDERE